MQFKIIQAFMIDTFKKVSNDLIAFFSNMVTLKHNTRMHYYQQFLFKILTHTCRYVCICVFRVVTNFMCLYLFVFYK